MENPTELYLLSARLEALQEDYNRLLADYDASATTEDEAVALGALAEQNIAVGKLVSKCITLNNAKYFSEFRLS